MIGDVLQTISRMYAGQNRELKLPTIIIIICKPLINECKHSSVCVRTT